VRAGVLCLFLLAATGPVLAETIVLRSGNAPLGNADPLIRMSPGGGGTPLSSDPFTEDYFNRACAGPNSIVCQPHGAWLQQLSCDPDARWIGVDAEATPASALYCHVFEVESCCIEQARLDFCWVTDDALGDTGFGGGNPDGVYVNGVAVSPSITGGSYATESLVSVDVTGLVHCGTNELHVYNRDAGFVVSGVMFSATFELTECATPVESSSWGVIKSLYR